MNAIERAAKIREALYVRGLAFSDIDKRHGLPDGTTSRTSYREPNARGEAALAAALDLEPQALWPERYDTSGHRLEPQPAENYRRPPTLRQRRSEAAA